MKSTPVCIGLLENALNAWTTGCEETLKRHGQAGVSAQNKTLSNNERAIAQQWLQKTFEERFTYNKTLKQKKSEKR